MVVWSGVGGWSDVWSGVSGWSDVWVGGVVCATEVWVQ